MKRLSSMLTWILTSLLVAWNVTLPAHAESITLTTGAKLHMVLETTLTTKTSKVGDPFRARLVIPVFANEREALPIGTVIEGTVASLETPGRVRGNAQMQLRLTGCTNADPARGARPALAAAPAPPVGRRRRSSAHRPAAPGRIPGRRRAAPLRTPDRIEHRGGSRAGRWDSSPSGSRFYGSLPPLRMVTQSWRGIGKQSLPARGSARLWLAARDALASLAGSWSCAGAAHLLPETRRHTS